MATVAIAPDQDVVEAEIFVAAPPARVFEAITDPAQKSRWWGQQGMYRTTEATSDLRPGGKWSTAGMGADGTSFRVEGEYLEVDPPRLLVHTWVKSWEGGPRTTIVRWELEPREVHGLQAQGPRRAGTGTLVKIRHSGFAGDAKSAADHGNGWKRVLGWMQAYAEQGETIESRPPLQKEA
jgi:uncharacterized protein YndB with AHSA1/START domain